MTYGHLKYFKQMTSNNQVVYRGALHFVYNSYFQKNMLTKPHAKKFNNLRDVIKIDT